MTFPPIPSATSANSQAELNTIAVQLGIRIPGLDPISQLQLVAANLLTQGPPISTVTVFNVTDPRYGAKGNGIADDASAINRCAAAAAAAGGVVYFPAGTYAVGTPLAPPTASVWIGDGMGLTTIKDHASLGAQPILSLVGTSDTSLRNIWIKNLTITNGTASTGTYTSGKDGILVKYVDGLTLDTVEITEIQGVYGLSTRRSSRIRIRFSRFYRCTYAQFSVLNNCDTIVVEDTTFDTCTTTTEANSYLFATGYDGTEVGDYFCKNVWLTRCRFLNNPRWEAIDFHGGENIWITDCYAENSRVGLMLGGTAGVVTNPVLKNVWVKNLEVRCTTGLADGSGIMIQGASDRSFLAENITIDGGRIEGFGGSTNSNVGAFTISGSKNVKLLGVTVDDYYGSGVCVIDWVQGLDIMGLTFHDCLNPTAFSSAGSAIWFRSVGVFGVHVEACTLDPSATKAPPFFASSSANNVGNLQFGSGSRANKVLNVGTARYQGVGQMPVEKSSIPTTLLRMAYQDAVLTNTGKPGWYCSAPAIGYGSLDTTTVYGTVTIAAGSNIATITSAATTTRDIPPGMNITIVGAGAAGADLNVRVLATTLTTLTLSANASTAVTSANVKLQACTLVAA